MASHRSAESSKLPPQTAPHVNQPNDDSEPKKRFRIQKRRLGKIKFIATDDDYGFIAAEDFKDDVFFHTSVWQGQPENDARQRATAPEIEQWVEFELDDDQLDADGRLRAKVVRPTKRPIGRKLSGRDATFNIVTHHPNARKRRPNWRKK